MRPLGSRRTRSTASTSMFGSSFVRKGGGGKVERNVACADATVTSSEAEPIGRWVRARHARGVAGYRDAPGLDGGRFPVPAFLGRERRAARALRALGSGLDPRRRGSGSRDELRRRRRGGDRRLGRRRRERRGGWRLVERVSARRDEDKKECRRDWEPSHSVPIPNSAPRRRDPAGAATGPSHRRHGEMARSPSTSGVPPHPSDMGPYLGHVNARCGVHGPHVRSRKKGCPWIDRDRSEMEALRRREPPHADVAPPVCALAARSRREARLGRHLRAVDTVSRCTHCGVVSVQSRQRNQGQRKCATEIAGPSSRKFSTI